MAVMQSTDLPKTLEIRYRKCFFEAYSIKKEQFRSVFNVDNSKKAKEEEIGVAGAGAWKKRETGLEPVPYDSLVPEYDRTYIHDEYVQGMKCERKWIDDEQYQLGDKIAKSIGRGGKILVEQTAATVLDNGFTVNGYDTVPLFSDSHPIPKPVSSGQVGDNLLTSAPLSEANMRLALLLLEHQPAPEGFEIKAKGSRAVVPTDLQFTCAAILTSNLKPGTDYNDKNVLQSIVSMFVYDWLVSQTNWFVQDESLNELTFYWRVKPEFERDKEFDTWAYKYKGYLRFSCGYSNWRGWVGCKATS